MSVQNANETCAYNSGVSLILYHKSSQIKRVSKMEFMKKNPFDNRFSRAELVDVGRGSAFEI